MVLTVEVQCADAVSYSPVTWLKDYWNKTECTAFCCYWRNFALCFKKSNFAFSTLQHLASFDIKLGE
jgi:hypothetical protein